MGNVTNDGIYTYSYDAEGRPLNDAWMQTIYDAFGRAVETNYNGTYTHILYGPSGQKFAFLRGQSVLLYTVPLAGGVQAVYNASGLQYYRHADWLGSSRFAATTSGAVQYDRAFAPYGETYAEIGSGGRSFTGQTQDVLAGPTGIYDFLFRQQASSQGRWLVPDPAGLAAVDLTNPQTWNRYAYVGNNPLSNVDPLGLFQNILPPPPPADDSSSFFAGGGANNVNRLQMIGDNKGGGGFLGDVSKFKFTGTPAPGATFPPPLIDQQGISFIAQCEGFSGTPYNDIAKNCTVGFGELLHKGPCDGTEASTSADVANSALQGRATALSALVSSSAEVPLNQSQVASLTDFAYNEGPNAFSNSTLLLQLNAFQYRAVPGQMARWVYVRIPGRGTQQSGALVNRRSAESTLFTTGTYGNCY